MNAVASIEPVTIPEGRLAEIRRLIRLLDRERSTLTVLEAYADEFRQFRSLQSLNRMTTAEAQTNRAREYVAEAIEAYRNSAA